MGKNNEKIILKNGCNINNNNMKLFSVNNLTKEWLSELRKTFNSGIIGQGPKTLEFEQEFGKKFGYKYCVAVNSGTAALELAYHLAGIKKGSKVLTPVLTCTATNLPLVHARAKIKFVDIDRNLTMNFNDFRKKYKKADAVVTVNIGGLTCNKAIYNKCLIHDIPVIVDACQSLGIPEPHGDYVVYSFQAIKHFSTGDGGMLVCRDRQDYERARRLRWFGIDKDLRQKLNYNFSPSNREMCMNMEEPGWKLHMNDIQATMGLVGLKHTDSDLLQRKLIANTYERHLSGKVGLRIISGGSHWLFCVLLEKNRDKIMDQLKERDIECDLVHLRNDIFTPFGSKRQKLPNMNKIESQYLYLPIHSNMSHEDATFISQELLKLI
jgi:dTDP-4-amino-4,6-dideoxygalactose transaminase